MIEKKLPFETEQLFSLPKEKPLDAELKLLTADVVYNGIGLPIEDGALLISQAETVVTFGKRLELQKMYPKSLPERVGRAILPKPANPHTHLDMSDFPYTKLPYSRWISEFVVPNRALRTLNAAKKGLEMLKISGINAFGDIVTNVEVMEFLLESELIGVAYWEVLDPNPATADETFEKVKKLIESWRKKEKQVRVGLSPHSAHTVSSKLLKKLADFAHNESIPMQIHLAESKDEVELFKTGTGPLAQMIEKAFNLSVENIIGHKPGLSPIEHLAKIGVLADKPTIVHGVNVTERDVELISQAGNVVVCCPRSNFALESGSFPWALYARYGVEMALATDSIASGQTLDIKDEVLFIENLNLRTKVRAVVKGGYRALDLPPPVIKRGDPLSALTIWS